MTKPKVDYYIRRPMREHEMNYAEIVKKQTAIERNASYKLQIDRCKIKPPK